MKTKYQFDSETTAIINFQEWILTSWQHIGTADRGWIHFRHHKLPNVRLDYNFKTNKVIAYLPSKRICLHHSQIATEEIEEMLGNLKNTISIYDVAECTESPTVELSPEELFEETKQKTKVPRRNADTFSYRIAKLIKGVFLYEQSNEITD